MKLTQIRESSFSVYIAQYQLNTILEEQSVVLFTQVHHLIGMANTFNIKCEK